MSTKTIINGEGKRYLSELPEFSNGVPFGVVNKKLTDVGGTYCAINCKYNYIVVVPFRDLAVSIENDENNKYNVFKFIGGVQKNPFKSYLNNNKIKKIAVTYDSLEKLTNWLKELGEDILSYKVLVDEYHLILEDLDFRDEAINKLVATVEQYNHYSFLSATPINSDFEFEFLKRLPHYELDFGKLNQIKPFKIKTPNVYKATVALIEEFNSGLQLDDINGNLTEVKELHIFLNSVKGIAQICKTAKLSNEDVRIVCADRIRNGILLEDYSISSISEPNAKINFYTKKGFQGCNVFSNNALVVVVSDAKVSHTLIDIETSLVQIVGRIRLNDKSQNIFRHKIYHIFSTNNRIQTDLQFEEFINTKKIESSAIYNDLKSKEMEVRELYIKRMNFESDFLSVVNGDIQLNLKKEQLFRYKFDLKKSYSSGLAIRDKYNKNEKFENNKQAYSTFDDVVLSKIASVKFEDLYKLFLEADYKEPFELEYPEFFEYEKLLKLTEMNTLKWNKDKINALLIDKKAMTIVHRRISDLLSTGFVSVSSLKEKYKEVMNELGIKLTVKGTLIEDNKFLIASETSKRIDNKKVKGYEISKLNLNNYMKN